jgi:hypothetical protein
VKLSLRERAENYARVFPEFKGSHLQVLVGAERRETLQGIWMFGQDYRNKSDYYGAYPGNYLERLQAMFPDYSLIAGMLPLGGRVLHAFSGSLPPGPYTRCDVVQPAELQCNVAEIGEHYPGVEDFELIVADTPYSTADSKKYQSPPPNRRGALAGLAHVARPGALLCWLDTQWPMHRKDQWATVGMIYIQRSTNHRIRLLSIFERA